MAPLAAEPRQLLVVLNPAKRRALFQLVDEITKYMRSQLLLQPKSQNDSDGKSSSDAPLRRPSGVDHTHGQRGNQQQAERSQLEPVDYQVSRIRRAAISHIDEWRLTVLKAIKEVASAADDDKILQARKERQVKMERSKVDNPRRGGDLMDFGDGSNAADSKDENQDQDQDQDLASFQALYHPIPTRLSTIPREDREEALSCVLVTVISSGVYAAHSRTLACYLASALNLPLAVLVREETEIANSLVESSTSDEAKKQQQELMSAEAEAEKRRKEGQAGRFWKVGLASVAGAAVIGITGGLAAPVVAGAIGGLMGSVGLGGLASFLGINGWLNTKEDVTKTWRPLGDESEVFALRYEMASLLALGNSLETLVKSYAWSMVKSEIIRRTALAALGAALWPIALIQTASNVDNPFSRAKNRSEKAGMILADALINKVQGERPVTLIGYSLGARVIYSCLESLAERKAFGLIEQVVFIGAPIPSDLDRWQKIRSVVSGKMFNVYSENDFILAFLYRATSIQLGIAGLQPVTDLEGVENLDLSDAVSGHLRYPGLIAKILTRCGFPNVRDGEGPIEEDKEAIQMQDDDGSHKTGSLIDFEEPTGGKDGPIAQKTPGNQTLPHRPGRNTVARSNSEMLLQQMDPLGSLERMDYEGKAVSASAPQLPGLGASAFPYMQGNTNSDSGDAASFSKDAEQRPMSKPLTKSPPQEDSEGEDSDEGWTGIQMIDKDELDEVGPPPPK
ncbi:transmembrane and coiled-coil domain-containing protein 4 [Pyricularia oryzae Y34]|uniref:Transmembrane and coiled-coil domain-containing protein 4 n=2 Tax=Pyricularia oryzae TaxID=318829 RepID=A0AA97P4U3_PYRO3|nr:transmembrane and coiled-coil domain-containing protein 4 [Pyricularia oryzae Y34]